MFGERIDRHMSLENAWKVLTSKIDDIIDFGLRFVKKEELLENPETTYIVAKTKELYDDSKIVVEKSIEQMLKIDELEKKADKHEKEFNDKYAELEKEIREIKETEKEILKKLDMIINKK